MSGLLPAPRHDRRDRTPSNVVDATRKKMRKRPLPQTSGAICRRVGMRRNRRTSRASVGEHRFSLRCGAAEKGENSRDAPVLIRILLIETKFGEDACDVAFHGGDTHDEFSRDTGVGQPPRRHQAEHVVFTRGSAQRSDRPDGGGPASRAITSGSNTEPPAAIRRTASWSTSGSTNFSLSRYPTPSARSPTRLSAYSSSQYCDSTSTPDAGMTLTKRNGGGEAVATDGTASECR